MFGVITAAASETGRICGMNREERKAYFKQPRPVITPIEKDEPNPLLWFMFGLML